MKSLFKNLLFGVTLMTSQNMSAVDINARISLKHPGDKAVTYTLADKGDHLEASAKLPLSITKSVAEIDGNEVVTVTFTANERTYFNFAADVNTGFATDDCEFYLPGFWYHRNLRSPKEAPSFHTSKSWNFREDRLSSPLTGVYNSRTGEGMSVMHRVDKGGDALATATEGEIILSGTTSLGFVGFDNESGSAKLTFGYPYEETPRRYIRKLTLAPEVIAFVKLDKGESRSVTWTVKKTTAKDYGDYVNKTWQYCFDSLNPQPIQSAFAPDYVKSVLSNFFRKSFVNNFTLKYQSGMSLRCDDCKPFADIQVGFCGRVLLNAFNSLEYGETAGQTDLVKIGNDVFDSFLQNGLTAEGYFYDDVNTHRGMPADKDVVHSIRQQSEGVYAVLHYLKYEKRHGRTHKEWEGKIRRLLDNFLKLQKADGSFARKFHDDGKDIDASGGSTPSATSTLVMGYKYFGDKRYLEAAKRTVEYLDANIISKSDYFSSTLDANCEDKEAAISAVTATYYMAMVTKGKERNRYVDLCHRACYFALSWYYMWDVPFAEGQMLGDLGFKSRGWGNVSVENNHIDVFVFELPHILKWIGEVTGEQRFVKMYDVIYSSLNQLLPFKGHMCGIAVEGYYPEVVQHTTWDYGRNGKGFYNDIFAPAWAIASLWELYSPTRTYDFLTRK